MTRSLRQLNTLDYLRSLLSSQTWQKLEDRWGPADGAFFCLRPAPGGYIDEYTGEVVQRRCTRTSCLCCNRFLLLDTHRAIGHIGADRMVTFTGLPKSWSDIQHAFAELRRGLRRDGHPIEMVYGVEPNPRDTGNHAHAITRVPPIHEAAIQERAWNAGLGRIEIQEVTYNGNFAYPIKMAAWNAGSLAAYQAVNGAHVLHATKRFWDDPETGERLNRAQAVARARANSRTRRKRSFPHHRWRATA